MKWVEDESLEDLWAEEDIYDNYDVSKESNINMITLNDDDEVEKLKYDSLRIRKNNTKTNIESYILRNAYTDALNIMDWIEDESHEDLWAVMDIWDNVDISEMTFFGIIHQQKLYKIEERNS